MDALLIALLLCGIAEAGGPLPGRFAVLRGRYGEGSAVFLGMMAGLAANAALSGVAGGLLAPMLTPEARRLFFALALCIAGFPLLLKSRLITAGEGKGVPPFPAVAAMIFIFALGEGPQFLIAGISADRADPWMAGIGGWLGSVAACLAPSSTGCRAGMQARLWRIAAAILFLVLGFFLAMDALRLM